VWIIISWMSVPLKSFIWQGPPQRLALESGEVHVWRIALDQSGESLAALQQTLSPTEMERAGRFYFPRDRDHFIAGRGCLRVILGRYLNTASSGLNFLYSSYGKPSLSGEFAGGSLRFNLSHSGGLGLIAVTMLGEVGVDIECIRRELAGEDIARHYFSTAEVEALMRLPPKTRREAFFTCWTRKEAYIKARGEGLSLPLEQFDVTLVPGEPAALLATRPDPLEAQRWILHALEPGDGYVAALAVEGQMSKLFCWDFLGV
jgi:4'-phosphopantetheinyl transferase